MDQQMANFSARLIIDREKNKKYDFPLILILLLLASIVLIIFVLAGGDF